MNLTKVAYRVWHKGIPPRPFKLQVPGWAGEPGYSSGVEPQPWHCKPFVDASTYGLELVYPFDSECVVTCENGEAKFTGDFSSEEKDCMIKLPPFMTFSPHHYGFTSSLDIETDPGFITRIEPHPRFYTDITGECPIAVAGHIESEWWPRIFFVVFKTPRPGERHVFRKGEGYAQMLVLPKTSSYDVRTMTVAEASRRNNRDNSIVQQGKQIASHSYADHLGHSFDNKYKVLSKVCEKAGAEGVDGYINTIVSHRNRPMKKIAKRSFKRIKKNEIVQNQTKERRGALQDIHQEQAAQAQGPAAAVPARPPEGGCPFLRVRI